jgi:hypothetical protein
MIVRVVLGARCSWKEGRKASTETPPESKLTLGRPRRLPPELRMWYFALMVEKKSARPRKLRNPALDKLQPAEAQEVLRAILKAHPNLREEAEGIARSLISEVSFDAIAGEVESELESHDLDELNSRAGKTRWGYVDPGDAAHEILHEAIDPIIDQMQRHLELGLGREALETCKGLVLGLYDVRNKKNDGCLGWAPDFASQTAEEVLEKWSKGIRGKGTRGRRASLRSFLDEVAPEWSSMFDRVLTR